MTWSIECRDDVDIWLEDPIGNILYFRNKDTGLMHLDRDDLGYLNDTITMPNGETKVVKINQEIVTIRGFIPGEWVLNIHMYRKRDVGVPTVVNIRVNKLNPTVTIITEENITLVENWQEETVIRFTMAADGEILSTDDLPKKLIKDNGPHSGGGV
jgi:hypothetical protein